MTDVVSMRAALEGVHTLFLLNAAVPGEVTQALLTLDLAREAGVQRIVYFSVFNSALFDDVPHFASKHLAERVIDAQALPATVLRPAAFMQNDLMLRDALKAGVYPQPIGGVGLAMVDTRDIAEAAAVELLRRERAPHPLPRTTIELVGPDTLTGADVAAIWASVLGRQVRYGGDDLAGYEKQVAGMMPGWQAHDFRVMLRAMRASAWFRARTVARYSRPCLAIRCGATAHLRRRPLRAGERGLESVEKGGPIASGRGSR